MAAELITPIDPITKLPALIAPSCNHEALSNSDVANNHHLWNTDAELRTRGIAGLALKHSAVQVVEKEAHNYGPLAFHDYWTRPELPQSHSVIFRRIVAACSGAISQLVADVNNGEPLIRQITQAELDFMRTPAENDEFGYKYIKYRYEPVRDFFRQYIFSQELSHIRGAIIDEFLHTGDAIRKLKLGDFLLRNATHVATDDVREDYFRMRKKGLIHPAMPDEVQTLVTYKLGNDARRSDTIKQYEMHLRDAVYS